MTIFPILDLEFFGGGGGCWRSIGAAGFEVRDILEVSEALLGRDAQVQRLGVE